MNTDLARRKDLLFSILSGIFLIAGLITIAAGSLIQIKPSPYKAVSQMLQFPDTRVTATTAGIRGRIDSVKSAYIRSAPGLSLKYTNTLPSQWVTLKDGDDPCFL